MGDRAHVIIRPSTDTGPSLFLYTHWDGYRLGNLVSAALKRGESRWDDEPYLNRIIASEIFSAAGIDDLTGAGLGTDWMEGQAPDRDVNVHHADRTVVYRGRTYTFAEFAQSPPGEVDD